MLTRWRKPGGPLWALLVLYPLWWALGFGAFAFVIVAIPMALRLLKRRPVVLPPAFSLWFLYLGWVLLSLVMIPMSAPNTTAGSTTGRFLGIAFRIAQLLAVTIIAIYVVNLKPEEVSQREIMKWLSTLFIVTILGGFLALAIPHFSFKSPLELVLPHSIGSNRYVQNLVHPQAAEVQNVLGYSAPRPAAPWGYTNFWGNNLSILLVWYSVYMWRPRTGTRRLAFVLVLALSMIPIVYSLNRGVWIGLILSAAYVGYRFAKAGDLRAVLAAAFVLPVAGLAFYLSPLHTVVSNRTSSSGSADIRSFADHAAIQGALESPVLGWGGTRKTVGSSQSIAVGPSPRCPNCGSVGIGSTGEFWMVAFSTGFVGVALYFGFFFLAWWRLRSDRTPTGAAARLIIFLAIFYSYFYNSLPAAAALTFISIAISWRTVLAQKSISPEVIEAAQPKPERSPLLIGGTPA